MEMSKTNHISSDTDTSGNVAATPGSGDAVTGTMIAQMIEAISAALSLVENTEMSGLEQKASYQQDTGAALINRSTAAVNDAVNALNTFVQEQAEELAAQNSSSIFSWITSVAFVVIAVVFCQPELALIGVAMLALQQSGGMSWMVQNLGNALGSQLAAQLLISVAIAAAGGGMSAGLSVATAAEAGAEAAAEAGAGAAAEDAGADAADDAASAATDDAGEGAATEGEGEQQSLWTRIANKLPFRNVPKPVAVAIVAGSSAAGTSGLVTTAVQDFVEQLPISKKAKEALEITLIIVVSALMAVAAGGAMTGLASSGTSMFDMAASRGMMELATATKASAALFRVATYAAAAGSLGEMSSEAVMGAIQLQEAASLKEQGSAQAISTFITEVLSTVNSLSDATGKVLTDALTQTAQNIASAGQGLSAINLSAARELCA